MDNPEKQPSISPPPMQSSRPPSPMHPPRPQSPMQSSRAPSSMQSSRTPSLISEQQQLDDQSVRSIRSQDRISPISGRAPDSRNMLKVVSFPRHQHSLGSLGVVASKSSEVLKLESVGDVDKATIENLDSQRRPGRRFLVSLRLRTKPPEITQDEVSVHSIQRGSNFYSRQDSKMANRIRRRRSAWGAQSIAATATIMTRRSKWVNSQSRKNKLGISFLERYQLIIEDKFGSCVACFFDFVRNLIAMNACLMLIWILFVVLPQAIYFDYSSITSSFYFGDVLKFEGIVGETWIFFGNIKAEVPGYHMWFAYFVCILCTFYFSLFWLIKCIVTALQNEGGHIILENYNFSYLTFTSWDYSLRNAEATDILCLGIANSFRDLISDVELNRLVKAMKTIDKTKLYLRRAMAWVATVILIAAGCAIIFNFVTKDAVELFQQWGYDWATRDHIVVIYFPTVVFSLVNLLVPLAIYQLPMFEFYIKPQIEVYITIFRVFVLNVANMVSLFMSLKLKISWENFRGCGGTLIGQEVLKLIVIDTVVMFASAFAVYLGYYLVFKFKKREFFMPAVVLKVIQEQTLIWIGTLACPLMPAFGCLFLLLTFFAYYYVIGHFCKPTSKRWLQPQRNIFFLTITVIALLALTITFIVINLMAGGFLLSKVAEHDNRTESEYANETWCGPLNIDSKFSPIRDFIAQIRIDDSRSGEILDVICSPIMVVTFLFILISLVYLLICRVRWEVEKRLVLLAEVQMERLQIKKFHSQVGDRSRHLEK